MNILMLAKYCKNSLYDLSRIFLFRSLWPILSEVIMFFHQASNLPSTLFKNMEIAPASSLFFDKRSDGWAGQSWQEVAQKVQDIAKFLQQPDPFVTPYKLDKYLIDINAQI